MNEDDKPTRRIVAERFASEFGDAYIAAHPPLAIGTNIPGWGRIAGIRTADSERFYFVITEYGGVSLIDDFTVRGLLSQPT